MAEPATIAAVAERYVEQLCELDPFTATYLGVPGHDHEVTDLSPAGHEARAELARRALADALAAPEPDDRARVAKAVMAERLSLDLEQHEAGLHRHDLNVLASPVQDIRQVFDLMDTAGPAGWEAVGARMAALPDAVAGLVATYREGIAAGTTPAIRQVEACIGQCERWAGVAGGEGFFHGLVSQAPDPAVLDAAASTAEGAYAALATFLREELAPAARTADPVGRDAYGLVSRSFTGAALDLDETYAWGWEELARLAADQDATAARVVPGGTLEDAVAALDADPRYRLEGQDALVAWMQGLSDRTLAELDGTHFDLAEPLRTLQCAIAPPGGSAGMYYTGPAEDWSRPGTMWWSLAPGQDTFQTWKEVTTVFHEGVPGHHLQVGQAVYRADVLTRFQSVLCFVSGHGEGWALYAERLMDELGFLQDPGDRLGMLDAQALRAARVVMDIGAHCGMPIAENPWGWRVGEAWSAEAMRELLAMRTCLPAALVHDEVDRYLGWPGQAPSYKVGERVWLDARRDAERRHGAAFDLKAFHTAALDLGPMGLDPLVAELARL